MRRQLRSRRAYELLSHRPHWQAGPAFYQRAEVHRLRGVLAAVAAELDVTWLHAMSDQMLGAVLLREGDVRSALGVLRRAWTSWQQLDVPYEAARTRVWIGCLSDARSARIDGGLTT